MSVSNRAYLTQREHLRPGVLRPPFRGAQSKTSGQAIQSGANVEALDQEPENSGGNQANGHRHQQPSNALASVEVRRHGQGGAGAEDADRHGDQGDGVLHTEQAGVVAFGWPVDGGRWKVQQGSVAHRVGNCLADDYDQEQSDYPQQYGHGTEAPRCSTEGERFVPGVAEEAIEHDNREHPAEVSVSYYS